MRVSPIPLLLATALAMSLSGCRAKDQTATSPPVGPSGGPPGPTAGGPPPGGTATEPGRGVGQMSGDAVLTGKVKNALMVSKVDTGKLNVDSANGVVTLKGSVPTASQKAMAEKVAKQVAGVSSVKNSLTVGGGK